MIKTFRVLLVLLAALMIPAVVGAEKETSPGGYGKFDAILGRIKTENRLQRVKDTQDFLASVTSADIPVLVKLLKSEDRLLRQIAIDGLAKVGDASTVDVFIKALDADDTYIRRRACEALDRIGDHRALPALVQALKSEDYTLRQDALGAVEKLAKPEDTKLLLGLLDTDDLRLKGEVIDLLGRLKAPGALPTLRKLLSDEQPYVRGKSAEALTAIGGAKELGNLVPLYTDENPYVKFSALAATANVGTDQALRIVKPFLKDIEAASDQAGIGMRVLLVRLMGDLADPSSTAAVLRAYHFDDGYGGRLTKELRLASVNALARIGGKDALAGLEEALKDRYPPVREAAAKALMASGDPAMAAPLRAFLDKESDPDLIHTLTPLVEKFEAQAKKGSKAH